MVWANDSAPTMNGKLHDVVDAKPSNKRKPRFVKKQDSETNGELFTNGTVATYRRSSVFVLGVCLLFHTCVGVKSFNNGSHPSQRRQQLLTSSRPITSLAMHPPIRTACDPTSGLRRRKRNVVERIRNLSGGFSSPSSPSSPSSNIDSSLYSNVNDDNSQTDKIEQQEASITSPSGDHAAELPPAIVQKSGIRRLIPNIDEEEKKLIKLSLPVIANFAINPLIGAVDLFWVNRMGNALAVAGQAAANQVFSSSFWFISFLPSVTATLVSKKHAEGDVDGTQDAICQALIVGFAISAIGTLLMIRNPITALSSVLQADAPALQYAKPYLLIRAFSFVPSIISVVGFSAFRGVLDTQTPVKISAFANMFNAILDPIMIFSLAMGVSGAALATLAAEIISAVTYLYILNKRKLIKWSKLFSLPKWASLAPLLKGGMALQLRNVALNVTFLMVARVTQGIDKSGVAAAAHAMAIQTFQIGGIVLLALSTVAQTVIPNAMVERYDDDKQEVVGGLEYAKATNNRLMRWGLVLGAILGSLQIMLLPAIRRATPLQEVRDAATAPALIGSLLQTINGLVFIGEGVMVGTGSFLQLSLGTVVATAGCLLALRFFPPRVGLPGVWIGFAVFNFIRLLFVWLHQYRNGPWAAKNVNKAKAVV